MSESNNFLSAREKLLGHLEQLPPFSPCCFASPLGLFGHTQPALLQCRPRQHWQFLCPSFKVDILLLHWLSSLSQSFVHFVVSLMGSLDRSPASYTLKGPSLMPPSESFGCRTQAAFIHALLPADHKPRHCARRPKIVETGEERFAGNLSGRHATNARLTYFLFSRPLFWNEQLHNLVHQEKGFWFIFCHKPKEYYCVSNQPWELEFMNM